MDIFHNLIGTMKDFHKSSKKREIDSMMVYFDLPGDSSYRAEFIPRTQWEEGRTHSNGVRKYDSIHSMLKLELSPNVVTNLITPRVANTPSEVQYLLERIIEDVEFTYSKHQCHPYYPQKVKMDRIKLEAKINGVSVLEFLTEMSECLKSDQWIYGINRTIADITISPYKKIHLILKSTRDYKLRITSKFTSKASGELIEYFCVELDRRTLDRKQVENVWNSLSVTKQGAIDRLMILKNAYLSKNYWAII